MFALTQVDYSGPCSTTPPEAQESFDGFAAPFVRYQREALIAAAAQGWYFQEDSGV